MEQDEPALADALPVELRAGDPGLRAWLEGTLGWQVVDGGADALVPPLVGIADVEGAEILACRPMLLVVSGEEPIEQLVEVGRRSAPDGVLCWPQDRERLSGVVAELLRQPATGLVRDRTQIRVGGSSGGAGATTVALALGGLVAWAGARVLIVSHGAVPAPTDDHTHPMDALASSGVWRTAMPTPGVPGLRVVRAVAPPGAMAIEGGDADVVVVDAGIDGDPDVLVIRRDAAGLSALAATSAGTVVVTDVGAAPQRAIAEAAAGRRLVVLPWSVRAGRAGLHSRIPSSLPGAWLRHLFPIARQIHRATSTATSSETSSR